MSGRDSIAWACGFALACCALVSGCGQGPVNFRSNMLAMTKNEINESQQQQIADILTALFGTPDEPYAPAETGLDLDKLRRASGPVHRDAVSGPKGIFREQCVHCHGITGDGEGPTAAFLNPYPRDYREGWYKWKSTKPRRSPDDRKPDARCTKGVAGTAMPSFRLLPDLDREALVEYVRYLSMRGEMELSLIRAAHEGSKKDEPLKTDHDSLLALLTPIVASRGESDPDCGRRDRPADMQWNGKQYERGTKEHAAWEMSKAIGMHMFTSEKPGDFSYTPEGGGAPITVQYQGAACIKCHGPTATRRRPNDRLRRLDQTGLGSG